MSGSKTFNIFTAVLSLSIFFNNNIFCLENHIHTEIDSCSQQTSKKRNIFSMSQARLRGEWWPDEPDERLLKESQKCINFNFCSMNLTQGCDEGDLPDYFFLEKKSNNNIVNPGVVSSRDFIIWAGLDFPIDDEMCTPVDDGIYKIDISKSFSWDQFPNLTSIQNTKQKKRFSFKKELPDNVEEQGLTFVRRKAERGYHAYQTILGSYYFYYKHDTKKGLYWAEKAAEVGETGSMVILGDAYCHSTGVISDYADGLKWYIIASSLGNTAAQGRLLVATFGSNSNELKDYKNDALKRAREWMRGHKNIFISDIAD